MHENENSASRQGALSVRVQFEEAERAFLKMAQDAKDTFASDMAKARAELPAEAQAEIDEAERLFHEAADQGAAEFYASLEAAKKQEAWAFGQ